MRPGVLLLALDVCSKLRVRKRRKRPNLNICYLVYLVYILSNYYLIKSKDILNNTYVKPLAVTSQLLFPSLDSLFGTKLYPKS